ncbi:MAG: membrane protein insertase YidC [Kiritimatiellae bacterium]|jgi:YidC/Oxa1 family membrane protein insertase|nr:membrane protein insertase YidC [Kiritimatiellia bacterium]
MNKQEMIIAALMGLSLVGWVMYSSKTAAKRAEEARLNAPPSAAVVAAGTTKGVAAAVQSPPATITADKAIAATSVVAYTPDTPEEIVRVASDDIELALSSYGGSIKSVILKKFNTKPGKAGENNPPVVLDFSRFPGFELSGIPGLPRNAAYEIEKGPDARSVILRSATQDGLLIERKMELKDDYQVSVSDTFKNLGKSTLAFGTNSVCLGLMCRGNSKNDIVSIDALPVGEKSKVVHWDKFKETKGFIGGAGGFGCKSGSKSALGMSDQVSVPMAGAQQWVAVKSRFFVSTLTASVPNCGYEGALERDVSKDKYVLGCLAAKMRFPGQVLEQGKSFTREYTMYVGPKKLDLLKKMGNGMDAIMEFGFFKIVCKPLVSTLNFFYKLIPNYGIAIILLTILVRIIFWPLTHKSTVSMRRMQELQPELKALQALHKENPQKLQKETWAIYKKNKVNPMSSCLPMLIQIPVFIALFTVLRSAVELRYASFLWIVDLSEPENLFAGMVPLVGSLNILPFLMSGTMALQSYLTPSTGDPQQQKMMMIMMPAMMLFMFYSFPAALSLYWTVSQILAIVQMLVIRRKSQHKHDDEIEDAQVVSTRQQRRQDARA